MKSPLATFALALCLVAPAAAAAPTPAEAARFLTQATFGPTTAEIDNVQRLGFEAWIELQLARTPTLHRPELQGLLGLELQDPDRAMRQEIWWRHAVTAPDQLRQRVAFALSEIMVVSSLEDQLISRPLLVAEFYDVLVRGAFGNYRQLLEQVTLSPAMGVYLSMIRNDKPDPASGRRPDENYAREVMQLFSIGLWQLEADGRPRLRDGRRIPTYTQATIENTARALTGWTWADATGWGQTGTSYAPMKAFEEHHDTGPKVLLDGVQVPGGRSAAQDLDSALDAIAAHANTGPFIARRLIQRLVASNPSPAYVGRVAAVFADNGRGVRGDLAAVVRAILLDAEARAELPAGAARKLREPLLRVSAIWRAFSAAALDGKYAYKDAGEELGQSPQGAPSVFNFFQPDYQPPGPLAATGLFGPEFQIQTETQGMRIVNTLARLVRRQYQGAPDNAPGTIAIRITRERAMSGDPATLVDHLDRLLLCGRMEPSMRSALIEHVAAIDPADTTARAIEAIFLVASSGAFAVQP